MTFDRKTMVIPDKTSFAEQMITTKGDVVIGDRSLLRFGIKTDGRIFIGEHAIVDGNLQGSNDIRVDIFSTVGGDITSGGNVYLGEKVKIKGKLSLSGDLDVGDSVDIEKGFEAKGWINIRSPIPVVIYIFVYLIQLLKMGKSEEIERILEELEQSEGNTIPISESFLFFPNNSIISISNSKVEGSLQVGKECKLMGNYDIKGNISIDEKSEILGTLKATGNVYCGKKVKIHGNIDSTGIVKITEHVHIIGNIAGEEILLSKTAIVQGTLLGKKGVSFQDNIIEQTTEKIKRFENDVDVVDEVKELLE
ncbi:MAG: acyltransferase [Candidatus Thermoplasmatota archaeon]|nr:acyltransferase [Candidatus Thermoplasmatota archaeon]